MNCRCSHPDYEHTREFSCIRDGCDCMTFEPILDAGLPTVLSACLFRIGDTSIDSASMKKLCSMAGIPPLAPANEWEDGLERILTLHAEGPAFLSRFMKETPMHSDE